MVYLPTFGWFCMENVGIYTIHGCFGYCQKGPFHILSDLNLLVMLGKNRLEEILQGTYRSIFQIMVVGWMFLCKKQLLGQIWRIPWDDESANMLSHSSSTSIKLELKTTKQFSIFFGFRDNDQKLPILCLVGYSWDKKKKWFKSLTAWLQKTICC